MAIAPKSIEEIGQPDERHLPASESAANRSVKTSVEPITPEKPPLDMLVLEQLAGTVQRSMIDQKLDVERAAGAIDLYQGFDPTDAMESILARLAVGLTNAAMDSLSRAASLDQTLQARQVELRLGQRCTSAVVEVLNLLHKLRHLQRQSVSVGSINLESGAQAIVGNVSSEPRSEISPAQAEPAADFSRRGSHKPKGA